MNYILAKLVTVEITQIMDSIIIINVVFSEMFRKFNCSEIIN